MIIMKNEKNLSLFIFFLLLIVSIFTIAPSNAQNNEFRLSLIVKNLNSPIFLSAPKREKLIFIVQQDGVIFSLNDDKLTKVLDISKKVTHRGEAGLLGFALHPDFNKNGLAYLSYTMGNLTSIIEEYRFDKEKNIFAKSSARLIYTLSQPAYNHNGGMIAFDNNGYLYASFGDGGGANDNYGNGQNFDSALGTIIRIAINYDKEAPPFSIPDDNPFPNGLAPESWIYGLRNVWRFSFDGDLLYLADVGQEAEEEINVLEAGAASSGANLGWPLAEGNQCLFDKLCKEKDLIWPIKTYPTKEGCAIIGGYVYRGEKFPELNGHYFYGDFCSGKIFSLKYENSKVSNERDWSEMLGRVDSLSSFGVDGFGEIYILSLNGNIYKLEQNK